MKSLAAGWNISEITNVENLRRCLQGLTDCEANFLPIEETLKPMRKVWAELRGKKALYKVHD